MGAGCTTAKKRTNHQQSNYTSNETSAPANSNNRALSNMGPLSGDDQAVLEGSLTQKQLQKLQQQQQQEQQQALQATLQQQQQAQQLSVKQQQQLLQQLDVLSLDDIATTLKSIIIKKYPVTEEYFKQRKEFMKAQKILPHEFHLVPAPVIMQAQDSTIAQRRKRLREMMESK